MWWWVTVGSVVSSLALIGLTLWLNRKTNQMTDRTNERIAATNKSLDATFALLATLERGIDALEKSRRERDAYWAARTVDTTKPSQERN